MAEYIYKAKNSEGKEIKGFIEASDKKQAVSILREKGLFCFSLTQKGEDSFLAAYVRNFSQVSFNEVVVFSRQLATMINAGLPLTEALSILQTQGSVKMKETISLILRDIREGRTLAEALAKFPKLFSPVYISLVRAGESAGILDNILNKLADNLEAQKAFKAKIIGALIYPAIILLGMVGVMFVMMIFVIPKMTVFYKDFGSELPAPTKILMAISDIFTKFWWLFPLVIFGVISLFKSINAKRNGRFKIDTLKLKIPIAGKLLKQVSLAEVTRTLGLLVGAGVSIVDALEISSKAANNIVFEEGILTAGEQVKKGFTLSSALAENPVFPSILQQMLAVGEETGKTDEILAKVAKFFQSESEEALKGLTTAIEPLIMIILGLGVGALIFAIIMPMYSMMGDF